MYHVDQGDIFRVHRALGERFCLSGGIPNYLLAFGKPSEVRERCRQVIEGVARDGGYIMDAAAIIQNDARVENMRALTEATLDFGGYSRGHASAPTAGGPLPEAADARPDAFVNRSGGVRPPGTCIAWERDAAAAPADPGRRTALPARLGIARRPGHNVRLVDRAGILIGQRHFSGND